MKLLIILKAISVVLSTVFAFTLAVGLCLFRTAGQDFPIFDLTCFMASIVSLFCLTIATYQERQKTIRDAYNEYKQTRL